MKSALDENITSAAELPYFEGDFWPNVLEESIKELDQEEEERQKAEKAAAIAEQEVCIVRNPYFKTLKSVSMGCNVGWVGDYDFIFTPPCLILICFHNVLLTLRFGKDI